MEVGAAIESYAQWFHGDRPAIFAVILTLLLYLAGRKAELSWHALQNTATTVVFSGFNVLAALLFADRINAVAQSAYDGLGIPTLPADFWVVTPLWAVSLIGLAAKDLADYVIHRLMHMRWLWPAHAAHHTDTYVNAFTSYRVHFLEGVLMMLTYVVMLTWLQMPEAIPVVAVLSVIHNMYVHMDIDIDHGPFKYLIASPRFHRWHHADVPAAYGKNLANIIPLYDLLFGTYYCPGPCKAELGAKSSGLPDKSPIEIWTYPFRQWAWLVRRAFRSDKRDSVDGTSRAESTPAE